MKVYYYTITSVDLVILQFDHINYRQLVNILECTHECKIS